MGKDIFGASNRTEIRHSANKVLRSGLDTAVKKISSSIFLPMKRMPLLRSDIYCIDSFLQKMRLQLWKSVGIRVCTKVCIAGFNYIKMLFIRNDWPPHHTMNGSPHL